MIVCSICNTSNHHLAVNCSSCRGYLQTRVDTLDLFSTAGRIIERPSKAFHAIAISRHKNYVLVLAALAGIGIAFTLFWAINASRYADSAASIFIAGFVAGPVFGIVLILFLSILLVSIARLFGKHAAVWSSFAVIAYASIPIVLVGLFILPVEMITFGAYFFSDNPSPYAMKPIVYIALLILHGTFALWNLILFLVGVRALFDASWMKSLAIWAISMALLSGLLYGTLHMLSTPR